ncbi:hypothetical protein V5799_010113 [Amblyomma americanum]|uniref:Uncharacterized protein n=1 Tax=Amblyomma americanum TaxID=6943 RepID=A0AAQ4F9X4_AMBAM
MPEFNPRSDNVKSYFERFENFMALNEVPEAKKLRFFLNVVGSTVYEELKKILLPDSTADKTFTEMQKVLEEHFSPECSVIAERRNFNKRTQQDGESVKDFMT